MNTTSMGSAPVQGALWGARAHDWAEIQEPTATPLFEAVLDRARVSQAMRVLDVGCGSGVFCALAAERGAQVAGLDAAEPLVAIARQRVPHADLRAGEIEALPFADGSFDLVTGFNAFQYASVPANALREARRVGRQLVIAVWGDPQACQAAAYLAALKALLPPPPPGAPGPFALSDVAVLHRLLREAGFAPLHTEDVLCVWQYRDLETALRGLLSAGPAVRAIQHSGEAAVRAATVEALKPFRAPDGSFRLDNAFRYVLAEA
jgi:SAM-dependent methyltransferase